MPKIQRSTSALEEHSTNQEEQVTAAKKAKTDANSKKDDDEPDLSTRERRIQHFNHRHIREMPKQRVEKIMLAIQNACPCTGRIFMETVFEKGYRKEDYNTVYRDICFEMAVLNEETCTISRAQYDSYLEEKERQIKELPDDAKEELSSSDEDEEEPARVLTCKHCIVAHRNDEPKEGFCYGCQKRVCSYCSKMCVTCNMRWCQPCAKKTGPFDEGCCSKMHFSELDYARRYWDSDEYNSSDLDDTWWTNEKCTWDE
jgi:hypothetical protein